MAASARVIRVIEIVNNLPQYKNYSSDKLDMLFQSIGVKSNGGTQIDITESSGAFNFAQGGTKTKLVGIAQPTAEGEAVALDSSAKVASGLLPDLSGTYVAVSTKGKANGVASLDSGGKVPVAQLPSAIMEYVGVWNATTNTPTLADYADGPTAGDHVGDVYRVGTAGTQNLGSGNIDFAVGDYVICNAAGKWEKSDTTDAVASVNTKTGIVVLGTDDIAEGTNNLYWTAARFNTAFSAKTTTDLTEGTNLYWTASRFNTAFSGKTTSDLTEGTNLYWTATRFNDAFAAKTTDGLTEGSTNLYFTASRAKTAAVVNSTSGSETDQAASVSAMKSYVASQVGSSNSASFKNNETGDVAHAIRQIAYFGAGGMKLAVATDSNIKTTSLLAMVKDTSIADQASGQYYLPKRGTVVPGFSSLTAGSPLFLSRGTPGGYASDLTGFISGDHVILVGWAVSATEVLWCGDYQYQIA